MTNDMIVRDPDAPVTLTINPAKISLLVSALELKHKELLQLQGKLKKARQLQSAEALDSDIIILDKMVKKLKPFKPVPLPFDARKPQPPNTYPQ